MNHSSYSINFMNYSSWAMFIVIKDVLIDNENSYPNFPHERRITKNQFAKYLGKRNLTSMLSAKQNINSPLERGNCRRSPIQFRFRGFEQSICNPIIQISEHHHPILWSQIGIYLRYK